jgi:hypothetical protein
MSSDEVINFRAKPYMRQCPCRSTIYFQKAGKETVVCKNCKRKHIVSHDGERYTYHWEPPDPEEVDLDVGSSES